MVLGLPSQAFGHRCGPGSLHRPPGHPRCRCGGGGGAAAYAAAGRLSSGTGAGQREGGGSDGGRRPARTLEGRRCGIACRRLAGPFL
jgi:hypothetical protein